MLEGHASGGEDVEEHDAFIGEEVLIEPVLEGVEQGQRLTPIWTPSSPNAGVKATVAAKGVRSRLVITPAR